MKTKLILLILLFSTLSPQDSYPPPSNLITIPTAGGLIRGSFSAERARPLRQSITRRGPDCASAAHGHVGDRACGLFEILCAG